LVFVLDAQITAWANAITAKTANASGTVSTPVAEGSRTGTTLFTAVATGNGSVTYAFTADGNPDLVASTTITNGEVTLNGVLDYETASSIVFKIVYVGRFTQIFLLLYNVSTILQNYLCCLK